jgi:hypothetical protein
MFSLPQELEAISAKNIGVKVVEHHWYYATTWSPSL